MRVNKWTVGLAAAGLVSLSPAILAQTTNAPAAAPTPAPIPMLTTLSATTISGYVDTSAVWNPGTGNAHPAPYAFNAGKQDGFNLDAVDVRIAKPQDETGWSAGYVAELSYGPDAMAIDAGAYPIRQAYVAMHMPVGNGIDWQLGRWDNLLGYESSDSYKNPNFTRSYGYTFEPTEHTGLLGNYNITSAINLQVGVADTVTTEGASVNSRSDAGVVPIESKKSLVSLLTLTAPDSWGAFKGSAFYVGFDYGQGAAPSSAGEPPAKDKKELYVGATVNTPVTGLTFGASWDAIFHNDVVGLDGVAVDESYFQAFAGYLSYKVTDKMTVNGRIEYADGEGLGAIAGTTEVTEAVPHYDGGVTETTVTVVNPLHAVVAFTGTLQYNLWDNVTSRLELRWDHATDGTDAFGGDGAIAEKKNEVMLAANVIYKF
jgi:hypothetical protein